MKVIITIGLIVLSISAYAQSTTATNSQVFPQTRFLGFTNNYSLTFRTNNILRMKLNTSLSYSVNAFPAQARDGYLLLGQTAQPSSNLFNNANFGAFSLLHLNGFDNGTGVLQQGGHKPWMKTGITFTDNGDMSYFGLRSILPDLTETVISWSEVQSNIVPPGQDDMVFRMTAGTGNSPDANIIGTFQSTSDLDGLHVARFTGFGDFALGKLPFESKGSG